MSGSTAAQAYIVVKPFGGYATGQLIPVASLTAAQVTANRGSLAGPISVSGSAAIPSGGSTAGTTATTVSGDSSTGTTTTTATGTTTSTTSGVSLTTAQTAALAGYPALNAAEIADASVIGTHTVHLGTLDGLVATLQQQASTNITTDASQTSRLTADEAEIATLLADVTALQAGGSGASTVKARNFSAAFSSAFS